MRGSVELEFSIEQIRLVHMRLTCFMSSIDYICLQKSQLPICQKLTIAGWLAICFSPLLIHSACKTTF